MKTLAHPHKMSFPAQDIEYKKKTPGALYYSCPNCQHDLDVLDVELARFDYCCPRCARKRLSEFELKQRRPR